PDSRPSLDFYCDCKVIPTSIADLQDRFSHQSYLLLDDDSLQKMNLKESKMIGEAKGFNLITTN
ncbi:phospholipid carrier-dependent glycosyltransferase, partial [Dolichospermum sp. ST_sed9]|nr:phospholipid carrier-dependent glycosyltransferase [Dolichospermum sp. ST_sed9]